MTSRHYPAEPTIPLFDSGIPDLASRADDYLEGFGEDDLPRKPGMLKGQIKLTDDWDSPEVNAEIAAVFKVDVL